MHNLFLMLGALKRAGLLQPVKISAAEVTNCMTQCVSKVSIHGVCEIYTVRGVRYGAVSCT